MTPLDLFFYPFFFLLGLAFGSFFNVVALRVPKKQSVVTPPSRCPHCGRRLNAVDLLPVIGFLLRKGTCATCGERIARLYPVGELAAGVLFVLAYATHKGDFFGLLLSISLVSLCMIVSISDIVYMLVPNRVLLWFFPLVLALGLLAEPQAWASGLIGGAVGFGLLLAVATVKPGALGMGDVKLFGVLGLAVGWPGVLVALFFASLIGLVAGVALMAAGKARWKGAIPFAPALCAGALVAHFWGAGLLRAYLSLFL